MADRLKLTYTPLDKLIPYARNSRTHSEEQVAQIAASIREFGFTNPVLVDDAGGIIAGHGRVMAARKLGLDAVPTINLGRLTDTQRRAYIIADNKLALNAGWDEEMLRVEFADLTDAGFDLSMIGFSEEELAEIMEGGKVEEVEGLTDEDEVPEVPEEPVTKPGDVWVMGKHRLMCGDSTSVDAVGALMNGSRADLCFTSPPYALGKSASLSGNKVISKRGAAYDTHDDDANAWPDLMSGWWSASLDFVSAWAVNVQPLAGNKRELFRWINERADRLADVATWDKGHAAPQIAPGVMASRFEWLLIFGEEGASRSVPFASWQGTVQSVYCAPPQRNNEFAAVHGATMPIHLAEWVCGTVCDKAKSVFDPFGGTGTTLVTCEKLGKQSYLMEISSAYCDVIVKRWQDFTGKQATLEADGRTFAEVAGEVVEA